mgnify:CR=1 FL=1
MNRTLTIVIFVEKAVEMLETAINMKPVFPDAINTLGVCYTKLEEYAKAIEFYEDK